MSLKSKVSISVCLLLAVSICIYAQVPGAHSWGGGTHYFITKNAIKLMPGSLSWFFDNYSVIINNYCTMPDFWRTEGLETGYAHYYDFENSLDQHVLDPSLGVLPWTVQDNFNDLVQYLKENDLQHAAQLAGVIAHYIGDASQPLHATSDYDPGGNHGPFESTVDYQIIKDNVNVEVPGFAPSEIDNIFSSTMQTLNESYSYTSVLNPYLRSGVLWNDEIKNITENRLTSSVQLLADIWYTAIVQSGISAPTPSPSSSTHSTNYTPYIAGGVLAIAIIGIVTMLYMRRH